jgi:hypothetical protein
MFPVGASTWLISFGPCGCSGELFFFIGLALLILLIGLNLLAIQTAITDLEKSGPWQD